MSYSINRNSTIILGGINGGKANVYITKRNTNNNSTTMRFDTLHEH